MKYNIILLLSVLVIVGAACNKKVNQQSTQNTGGSGVTNTATMSNNTPELNTAGSTVSWSFNGSTWIASGTPPTCLSGTTISTPVDLSLASAILYPGQTRGGDYKAHGGFRFDGQQNSNINITAPLEGRVYNASRYIEQGEIQYLFTFINPCGLAYRFDHLLKLTPAMQAIADTLPPAQVDNSATTMISDGPIVLVGEEIASAVGFEKTKNVSVDFGFYDLRQKNAVAADAAWASSHSAEYAQHGVCWLDLIIPDSAMNAAKALPAGDSSAGKKSDYCT